MPLGEFALGVVYELLASVIIEGTNSNYDNFMNVGALPNGILIRMKSEDIVNNNYLTIQTTWDLLNKFADSSKQFYLKEETASKHYITTVHTFDNPLLIKKSGSYQFDDYIVMDVIWFIMLLRLLMMGI